MKLLMTIDVEEEGLFRGRYDHVNVPVTNVPELRKLDPLFREWGITPTLFLTYQVVRLNQYHGLILDLKQRWNSEIGAHLHHWNTPPVVELPSPPPVPSEQIPYDLLGAKVDSLLQAFQRLDCVPVSFRMGRFNMGANLLSILETTPIRIDSSVAPMRTEYGGPNHLSAPIDPYFPDARPLGRPGYSHILEVPITIVPLIPKLGHFLESLRKGGLFPESWIAWIARNLGSITVQPGWTGLQSMKAAVELHRRRGGQILTMFFHSSELMAGFSPLHPSPEHVDRFIQKLWRFFAWLHKTHSLESLTLSGLRDKYFLDAP